MTSGVLKEHCKYKELDDTFVFEISVIMSVVMEREYCIFWSRTASKKETTIPKLIKMHQSKITAY